MNKFNTIDASQWKVHWKARPHLRIENESVPVVDPYEIRTRGRMQTSVRRARCINVIVQGLLCFVAIYYVGMLALTRPQKSNPTFQTNQTAERGKIVDRNGHLLATNINVPSLGLKISDLLEGKQEISAVAKILKMDEALLISRIERAQQDKVKFIKIKRMISPGQLNNIRELGYPAWVDAWDQARLYTLGSALSHVIGFTNLEQKGMAGIERALEKVIEAQSVLQISIDSRVQTLVAKHLHDGIVRAKARGGAAVLINNHTGEIVAMVSLPDFNPHDRTNANGSQNNGSQNNGSENLFNKVTQGVYEMGSVMKVFNMAIGIDTGFVRKGMTFDATVPMEFGKHTIKDLFPKNRHLSPEEIIAFSSNIGSARIAIRMGVEKQKSYFQKLGFMQPLEYGAIEKAIPLVPGVWRPINGVTVSFGYGIALSPLHVATGFGSVVNGGWKIRPRLLKVEAGDAVERNPEDRIFADSTSKWMRGILREHTIAGQGLGEVSGYEVLSKSGTAEKSQAGSYARKDVIASFLGAFPGWDPQWTLLVNVDEPRLYAKANTGSLIAGPIFANIVRDAAPLLNVASRQQQG